MTRLRLHFSLYSLSNTENAGKYHAYLLVASPWQPPGAGVASILPLREGSPMPDRIHFLADSGGPHAAIKAARDAILALEGNVGLKSLPEDLDSFEVW